MKYLSVCSGIEAATVAWHPLDWKPVAFSEIEPFPCAVLAHHYPDVPNLGDMTKHKEWPDEILADADVIVGGSPCQSFSIAGKRLSLKDERGNLAITFINIINEADEKRSKTGRSPVVCVWENVPGVLSTKDNAFGCFLGALSGEDVALEPPGGKWKNAGCVFGPTRTIAWRILDAQYFGVPQRRRRVFVVASARDGFDPRQVLFESEGVRRDSPPRRETREDIAGSTGDGIARCISAGEAQRQDWETCNFVAAPLGAHKSGRRQDLDNETYVTHSLRADGFDASEDGTGSGTPLAPVVGALACNTGPNGHDAGNFACNQAVDAGHVLPVVRCQKCGEQFYDQYGTGIGALAPYECPRCGEEKRIVPVAFDLSGRDGGAMPEGAHDTANIRAASGGSSRSYIPTASAVRRLTPRECERLQGFPDDYTAVPCRGKPAADGPRYRALGNSMAVPCMRWIGERIQMVDEMD